MVASSFPRGSVAALPPMRQQMMMSRDVLRRSAGYAPRVFQEPERHVRGYTGYIPGLQNTFGITYGTASATMLDAGQNRDEPLHCAYSPTSSMRKLQCNKSIVGGPLMNGLVEPVSRSLSRLEPLSPGDSAGRDKITRTHLQGSEVDKDGYYQTLIANDYQGLRVKTGWNPKRQGPPTVKVGSGNPNRNYSAISFGDRLYFSGSHMYVTQTGETSQMGLDKDNGGKMSHNTELLSTARLGGCTRVVRSPRSPKFGFTD